MRKFSQRVACGIITLCLLALCARADAAGPHVDARLSPAEISVGDTARLTVTVNGQSVSLPSVPQVPGLSISSAGQSSQFQIINGVVSATVTFLYQVSAQHAGTFTIPPIQTGSGTAVARSSPLVLRVVAGTPGSHAGSQAPGNALPPPAASFPREDAAPDRGDLAFLHLKLPRKEVFVGELVPVHIRAYFRSGMQASINGQPLLKTDAFTLNQLSDKPQQTEEMVSGQPYAVLTWTGALSAVKAGAYSLSVQLPATLTIRERPTRPRDPMADDPFGGSLMDDDFFNGFFGRVRQKQVTLSSGPNPVKVLSLPEAGRPADFSGAVGHFEVKASAAPLKVTAGDPITLKLEVSGEGNFDRVASAMVPESAAWKTYSPTGHFTPRDSAGYQGEKTFEQAVVPLQAPMHVEEQAIPAIPFTYFDPQVRQYVKRTTPPIRVEVAPSLAAPATAVGGTQQASAGQGQQDLVPNQVETGHLVATLRPVYERGWFLATQGVPLLLMAGGMIAARRYRRRRDDPSISRLLHANQKIRALLKEMDRAASVRDTASFFRAARGALQQRLGPLWGVTPEAITLSEIGSRMDQGAEEIRSVFEMADEVTYSGRTLHAADFDRWRKTVLGQLAALEESR